MSDDDTDDRRLRRPWREFEMIFSLCHRWDITEEEAEVYLEEIGAFGPKEDWVPVGEEDDEHA